VKHHCPSHGVKGNVPDQRHEDFGRCGLLCVFVLQAQQSVLELFCSSGIFRILQPVPGVAFLVVSPLEKWV
jgi:hypothetical protein